MEADDFYSREITLENQRVLLVPFHQKYRNGLQSIIYDNHLSLFSVNCSTEADLDNYIDRTIKQRTMQLAYPFIVIDKNTGNVAGATRLGNINFLNKRLEIGWTWYGKDYRGTGLNKASKYELLKYVFEEIHYRRVQFSTDIENFQSQKAILKLGATQEGIFRSNYINSRGESRDDIYYSIVHSEWQKIKTGYFREYKRGI